MVLATLYQVSCSAQSKFCFRNRVFYGQKIQTFLQRPGETIYMPNTVLHSVWNITPTIAIGDNPSYNTSFTELTVSRESENSKKWAHRVFDSVTGKDKESLMDIKRQVNQAILTNSILTYNKPVLWEGMSTKCFNDV